MARPHHPHRTCRLSRGTARWSSATAPCIEVDNPRGRRYTRTIPNAHTVVHLPKTAGFHSESCSMFALPSATTGLLSVIVAILLSDLLALVIIGQRPMLVGEAL